MVKTILKLEEMPSNCIYCPLFILDYCGKWGDCRALELKVDLREYKRRHKLCILKEINN